MKTIILSIIVTVAMSVSACLASDAKVELSTPEQTMASFVKAFQAGNDQLLTEVLADGASLYEFNPTQTIECPSSEIVGHELSNKAFISKNEVSIDLRLIMDYSKANKCNNLPEKTYYILKLVNERWLLVTGFPFWLSDIEPIPFTVQECDQ